MKVSIVDLILKILIVPELIIAGYLLVFYILPFIVNLSVSLVIGPV